MNDDLPYHSSMDRLGADEERIVLLAMHQTIENDELWRYGADFKTLAGKQVGVKPTRLGEGAPASVDGLRQAGVDGSEIGPGEESALAQLAQHPAPLHDLASSATSPPASSPPSRPSSPPSGTTSSPPSAKPRERSGADEESSHAEAQSSQRKTSATTSPWPSPPFWRR